MVLDEQSPILLKDGGDLEAQFADTEDYGIPDTRPAVQLGPNGKEKVLLFIGAIGSLGLGAVPLAFYYFFGALLSDLNDTIFEAYLDDGGSLGTKEIDEIISDQVEKTSYYIFAMAGVAGISAMLQLIPLIHVGESISSRLRLSLYGSILFQEIGWFDQTDTGTLASHLSEDCLKVKDAYGEKLGQSLQALAQSIGGLGFAMYKSWSMSLVMLGMAPIIAIPVVCQAVHLREITEAVSKASAEAMSAANETIAGVRTLRAFSMEYSAIKRFNDSLENLRNVASRRAWLQGITMGFIQIAIWGACGIAFLYGGYLIKRNEDFNIGDLITVFGMMLFACVGLSQAVAILPEFAKSRAAFDILRVIIERDPQIPPSGGLPVPAGKGVLEFANVSFSYPSRPDLPVMSDLSFTALPGTVVAFVGESGSGKTTIFNLIERFYDPTMGRILLDGQDIRAFDPPSLRSIMSIVSQEPVLFAATIKENILFAKPDASDSDVVEAAKIANAHNFIVDLPDGYNTWVGERGVQLSGGQKQRVAIARAVLRNPRILLLDEATSALDTESERLVQEALENIMVGRTSFVIAHRLATVVRSDQILVMSKGRLVGAGTHESLLADNEMYQQLALRQLSMHQPPA